MGRIDFLLSGMQRLMASRQGSAAKGHIPAALLSPSLLDYSHPISELLGVTERMGGPLKRKSHMGAVAIQECCF